MKTSFLLVLVLSLIGMDAHAAATGGTPAAQEYVRASRLIRFYLPNYAERPAKDLVQELTKLETAFYQLSLRHDDLKLCELTDIRISEAKGVVVFDNGIRTALTEKDLFVRGKVHCKKLQKASNETDYEEASDQYSIWLARVLSGELAKEFSHKIHAPDFPVGAASGSN